MWVCIVGLHDVLLVKRGWWWRCDDAAGGWRRAWETGSGEAGLVVVVVERERVRMEGHSLHCITTTSTLTDPPPRRSASTPPPPPSSPTLPPAAYPFWISSPSSLSLIHIPNRFFSSFTLIFPSFMSLSTFRILLSVYNRVPFSLSLPLSLSFSYSSLL